MAKSAKTDSKKVSAKKTAPSQGESGLKYEDKSGGQPEMVKIFEEIKSLLLPYEKGSIQVLGGSGGQITLVSKKAIEVEGRMRSEVWFAAALIQKGYVGFYYMPVYVQPEIRRFFKPALLKCLKGKSCFHINKYDKEIFAQIKEALNDGYQKYKERGWV